MSETPGPGDSHGRDPFDASSEEASSTEDHGSAELIDDPDLGQVIVGTEPVDTPEGDSAPTEDGAIDVADPFQGSDGLDSGGTDSEGSESTDSLENTESLASTDVIEDGMAGEPETTESVPNAEVVDPPSTGSGAVISIWPVWAWTMVGVVVVVVGLGIGAGVLAKTLLLDVISFWPGFVLIVLIFAALIPRLRKGAPRLSAVLPLLLLTYLGVTVALHVARWDELPSTAADTFGPPVESVTDGRIELDLPGELVVRPADQPELYRVFMLNRGGGTGAPSALEIVNDGEASISVSPRSDSGWFRSVGWSAHLSLLVTWEVEATADLLDIDLSAVSSGGLSAVGDGTIVLGFVRPGSVIALDGTINLIVREGDHIDLVGSASVPDDWTTTGVGMSKAGPADPYTVTVSEGSIVTITER